MPHSLATTAELTCNAYTQPFTAELWLIVDTVERPDLLARIRDGALHDVTCLHCGATNSADAPLLAYRPDRGDFCRQISALEAGGHDLRHPFWWAAFSFTGV